MLEYVRHRNALFAGGTMSEKLGLPRKEVSENTKRSRKYPDAEALVPHV